jgi:hypothetical protein
MYDRLLLEFIFLLSMIYDIYVDPRELSSPSKTKESIDHPKDLRSKLILEASQQSHSQPQPNNNKRG